LKVKPKGSFLGRWEGILLFFPAGRIVVH
jgi:hypothetical protein